MNFDLTTFILEIINFLVLLWLLQRFLYKPVLKVINERQATIEKKVGDAQKLVESSRSLQNEYQIKLDDWEKQKFALKAIWERELQEERKRAFVELQKDISEERQRAEVLAEVEQ